MFKWFDDKLIKSNPDKCHLFVSTNDNFAIRIGNFRVENTKSEKLIGIQFDNKLSFDYHFTRNIKKTSRKLYALRTYMNLAKRKILMNVFFNLQFSYCPLKWMRQSRIIKKNINRLQEKCLRIIYCDKQSSFEELLDRDLFLFTRETSKY